MRRAFTQALSRSGGRGGGQEPASTPDTRELRLFLLASVCSPLLRPPWPCGGGGGRPSCVAAVDFSDCDVVTDAGALAGVSAVVLQGCKNLVGVGALSGAHSVDLAWCDRVTDVSALGRVHSLNLMGTGVVDVTGLGGGNHAVNLSYTKVRDVGALAAVHTLVLDGCSGLEDMTGHTFRNHALSLSGCPKLSDCSTLGRVHTLTLSSTRVAEVSALADVKVLHMRNMDELQDVTALGNAHFLDLSGSKMVEDVSVSRPRPAQR